MTCYSRVLSFYNSPLRNRITCYFILCVFLLGFTSCDGFFETEIKIDPPDFDELIAIHSFLDADRDSTALILVSISQGIFEQRSLDKLLNDAEVRVFSENSELQVMTGEVDHFSSRPFANFKTESYDFQTGNQVDIAVSIDGNEGAFVSQKIPESVVPDSVVLVRNAGISLDGRRSGLDIYFQDPPGEENFYFLTARLDGQFSGGALTVESLEPGTVEYKFGILLRDRTFDGEYKRLRVLFTRYFPNTDPEDIELTFRHISEDYFRHLQSVERYNNSVDNPFVTPAQLYSNVEGGLGIFAVKRSVVVRAR
jgi:hypothetical protein